MTTYSRLRSHFILPPQQRWPMLQEAVLTSLKCIYEQIMLLQQFDNSIVRSTLGDDLDRVLEDVQQSIGRIRKLSEEYSIEIKASESMPDDILSSFRHDVIVPAQSIQTRAILIAQVIHKHVSIQTAERMVVDTLILCVVDLIDALDALANTRSRTT